MKKKSNKPNKYRVRRRWDKPESEIGVYNDLKVAVGICDSNPEFSVYDKKGKIIYSIRKGIDNRKKLVSKTQET